MMKMQIYAVGALFVLGIVSCKADDDTPKDEGRRGRTSRILNTDSSENAERVRAAKVLTEYATAAVEGRQADRAGRVIELDKAVSSELMNILKISGRATSLADLLLWPFRRPAPKATQDRKNNATSINFDSAFEIIAAIDEVRCVPRAICEINASQNDKTNMDEFEKIVIKMFSKPHTKKETAAGKLYREAATMGANLKSPLVCQSLYPTCKYPSQMLRNALIGEPITKQAP